MNTDKDVLCGDACKSASVKATVLGEGKELLIRALDMGLSNIEKEYGKKYLQVHYKEV